MNSIITSMSLRQSTCHDDQMGPEWYLWDATTVGNKVQDATSQVTKSEIFEAQVEARKMPLTPVILVNGE